MSSVGFGFFAALPHRLVLELLCQLVVGRQDA